VLLALVLPAVGCWEDKQPATWKSATGAEALEKLFWDEVKAKNYPEIERHVAATYTAVGPRGAIDRAGFMEHVKQFEIEDYTLGNLQSSPNGSDVMVTYDITIRGRLSGQPLPPVPFHMLTVWQQFKGGWMMVAHATVPPARPQATE
jgi:hypothetical protein